MFRFLAVFSIFLLTAPVFAQEDVENQISKGLELANNFAWEKSDEVFQKLIDNFPDDPRGYYFKSRNFIWAYLSNKSQSDYKEFFRLSDIALKKAESRLDGNSKDELGLFITGSSYNYRAVAFGKDESYVNAIWAFKKSSSYLKDLIAVNKTYYDAYLGLGVYNLVLSEIPGSFKWALSAAGILGDKNTGLNYLKTAAQNGRYLKAEAQYYLSQVYSDNLQNYNSFAGYLKNLTSRYPQNALFQYSYAALLMKQRKLTEAEAVLNKVMKLDTNAKFRQVKAYAVFSMGDIHYRKNEFTQAREYYNKFLKMNSFNEYTGIANLRLGISNEFLNDRNAAVKCFELAQKGNQNFEEDVYAKRKGAAFHNRTIAGTEQMVIKGANFVEAGEYNKALVVLTEASQSIKTERLNAEAFLYTSDALFELGRYNESAEYARKAENLNLEDEKWIQPNALFFKARAFAKMGDSVKAKSAIKEAQNRNNYDFEKKLNILINNLSRSINH